MKYMRGGRFLFEIARGAETRKAARAVRLSGKGMNAGKEPGECSRTGASRTAKTAVQLERR
jgi:hypothetical protein